MPKCSESEQILLENFAGPCYMPPTCCVGVNSSQQLGEDFLRGKFWKKIVAIATCWKNWKFYIWLHGETVPPPSLETPSAPLARQKRITPMR